MNGEIAITPSEYMSVIGALIGCVAALISAISVILVRSLTTQMKLLREDNEKLWEQVGELRGALQQTRENYVNKHDFDGAMNRLIFKLDRIEVRVGQSLTRYEYQEKTGNFGDRSDDPLST